MQTFDFEDADYRALRKAHQESVNWFCETVTELREHIRELEQELKERGR